MCVLCVCVWKRRGGKLSGWAKRNEICLRERKEKEKAEKRREGVFLIDRAVVVSLFKRENGAQ